jgi:hypothetical protein
VSRRPVFLFDIDGVLVEPGGYRQASQAALNYFARRMGLEDQILSEHIFSLFESQNIISEWDIVPLCLAAIVDDLMGRCPGLSLPGDLSGAFEITHACDLPVLQVDYKSLTSNLGAGFQPGKTFAGLALLLNQPGAINPPFPNIQGHPLLSVILEHTRDGVKSPVTRIFQQFVLGCETFQKVFDLPYEVETGSYLMQYDRPALDAAYRDELMDFWRKDRLDLAAYTIRPSLLVSAVPERILPYAPEADLALQINGLDAIPRMGYGQVYRAAELAGISPDLIIKPSPVQALGAIGAAVFRDELQAMVAAVNWIYRGDSTYFERLPALDIHIFEDSAGSILGVKSASDRLNQVGVPVQFHAWGIANSPVKIAALQSAQAEISSNVNVAVQEALTRLDP